MNPQVALILVSLLGRSACPAIPDLEKAAKDTETKVDDTLVGILKIICLLTGHGEFFDVIKKET